MDFTSIIVFIIVLFMYLHITSQWKRSEDLEIYEMDYESNTQLQEVCDVKQPVLFEFRNVSPDFFETITLDRFLSEGTNQDVCVKDILDYTRETSVDSIVIPLKTAHPLLKSDPSSHLISEGNSDFLEETSYTKCFHDHIDEYLKPPFSIRREYDICMGSDKSTTPFRYHTHSRHYCIVASGTIHVKMAPWKSEKCLHPIHDYENLEFFSHVNPWAYDQDKIKFLEFEVQEGHVLYVPPYWWYSIKYDSCDSLVCTATYNTTMNLIANAKHWLLYFFQQQNIQQKTMKPLDMSTETETSRHNIGNTHDEDGNSNNGHDNEEGDNQEAVKDVINTLHNIDQ